MPSLQNSSKPPWPNPEASICNENSWLRPVKGKSCWSIQGPALQAYNIIRERIKQCLTEKERDLYEDQDESSVPHWIDCSMVGSTKARARPYIIVSCSQESFCWRLMGIIKESIWWREFDQKHLGFGGFLLLRYAPKRTADANVKSRQSWVYTSDQASSRFGVPIFFVADMLGLDGACAPQQATFGNIVYLDGQPFGLTVAHPLVEQRSHNVSYQHPQESDAVFYMDNSDDESSADSCSTHSSAFNKVEVLEALPSEQFVRPQPLKGSPRLLGQLVCSSEGTPADGIDWALIALTQDRGSPLWESAATIGTYLDGDGHPIAVPTPRTVACPGGNVVPVLTISGQNRIIKGILSANKSLVCLLGSRQYLSLNSVILTEDLIPGDCGKWVFDHQGNWYGHVIAGIPGTRIAYVALASQIVDNIQTRIGITSLSLEDSQSHEHEDPSERSSSSVQSSKVEAIQSQKTYTRERRPRNEIQAAVKTERGVYGNALYAASRYGRENVVQMMVDNGANVNGQGGRCGNALQAASYGGHENVVQMLLDAGADVNAQGGHYENALQAALLYSSEKVVQILLDAGADMNTQGGYWGSSLQAASYRGYEKVVQMLLDAGADVNAQGGHYGNALQAASWYGYEKMVRMLLDAGADVHAQGGYWGSSLQAASAHGQEKVMQMLLDAGADINAQGGRYGNALQAASYGGYEKVVQMLLNKGANINAEGGHYGNALQAASWRGHEKVMQMLVDAGAGVDAQGGHYGNALQAASAYGSKKLVQMLLDKGADVNAQGGHNGNALQAASMYGFEKVVRILLDAGAEINAQGGEYGNALQAASRYRQERVVQTLLDKGADISIQGGRYNNALQAASYGGHEKVVQMLLNNGVDANTQGGEYGNALQAASYGNNEKVVHILLDTGAEVNVQGGHYGNALQAASAYGGNKVVQVLLDAGADVNAQGGHYRNALQAASHAGHEKVVQTLVDAGASVNAQ